MSDLKSLDPRELILEAYRIDGITGPDCRSIFLDWALGLPPEQDMAAAAKTLHDHYASTMPDHPMTSVLAEADAQPKRRGGRRRR